VGDEEERLMGRCEVNLQWKGTDACYDFYCPCGWEGADDAVYPYAPHWDGYSGVQFQCGGCGQWWHLPHKLIALPGKFHRDDGTYGCDDCDSGHRGAVMAGTPEMAAYQEAPDELHELTGD
jgi:hypothetical protein